MANVLIHRCTLRVVRRGGWSWGPSPKRLVDRLVQHVPALLERVLADLVPDDAEHEIAAPVRIQIPICQHDLDSLVSSTTVEWHAHESALSRALATKVRETLRDAASVNAAVPESDSPANASRAPADFAPRRAVRRKCKSSSPLLAILLRWHQQGVLYVRLAEASVEELVAWNAMLRAPATAPEPATPIDATTLAAELSTLLASRTPYEPAPSRELLLRRRLQLAVEAVAKLQLALYTPGLWRFLDAAFPLDTPIAPPASSPTTYALRLPDSKTQHGMSFPTPHHLTSSPTPPVHPTTAPVRLSTWEVHVSCALPFLLLGPLSRLHFFDAASAVVKSAKVPDTGDLLAASLAYKVLDPPDRGWLRSPSSQIAAAAFAGHPGAIDEAQLAEFARQLAPYTQLFDRLNIDTILAGHTSDEPFLILRADAHASQGYLVVDAQGCFPICWTSAPSALIAQLSRSARPIVLVARGAADPAILESLDRAGVAFIVGVNPTRGEHWNRVALSPAAAVWTNHPDPASTAILRATLQFAQAAQEGANFWEQLGRARVSVIHAASQDLDHALTLAAGTALGTIAWKLWGERSRTTPQLVLERFGDLDAYVKFNEDAIIVRLPLGRRHRELLDKGLLAPVDDAFWFGDDRRVEFAGG
jgi:hypothetical protein